MLKGLYKNWFIHNVIAHPLMYFLTVAGFDGAASKVHDGTLPQLEDTA